jgi:transposase
MKTKRTKEAPKECGKPKQKTEKTRELRDLPEELQAVNLDAAAIDIGSREHYVCVPASRDEKRVRRFLNFHCDLEAMAQWLEKCRVRTVVMESTGVYWIPAFQILERAGFEVMLVDPREVKNVRGRKSDMLDCQWFQQLHTYGLLHGCFRPADQICVFRSYLRLREDLTRDRSKNILLMQKALQQMNLQLHHVLSDITGESGMAIIRAIVAGERDPAKLVRMVNARVKASPAKIMAALGGDYRAEHIFALRIALEMYDHYTDKIIRCDQSVAEYLGCLETKADPVQKALPCRKKNLRASEGTNPQEMRTELIRISGVDLTAVEGISVRTAQVIISEIGFDMSPWGSEKQFTSWLALCPNQKISGGIVLSSRPRRVRNRVRQALRLAASTLRESKTALGAFFRRMRARLGSASAITATAHKLARIVYRLLKFGEDYVAEGMEAYENRYQERLLRNMMKTAKAFGYELVPKTTEARVS